MGRLRFALAALLLIPLLDALLLAYVASAVIGWKWATLLVVLTAFLGTLFVRAEGRHTLRKIQRALAEGRAPTNELIDGGLLVAAGAFLLSPGFVTDTLGFLLVIPITRAPIRAALKRFVVVPYVDAQTGGFASGKVYTFGFPGDGASRTPGGWTPGDSGNHQGDDTVDLGPDAYDVEFDDADETDGGDQD